MNRKCKQHLVTCYLHPILYQQQMKIRTLIAGYVLALALFLFAQRHPAASSPTGFRAVVDLTHASPGQNRLHRARGSSELALRLLRILLLGFGLSTRFLGDD